MQGKVRGDFDSTRLYSVHEGGLRAFVAGDFIPRTLLQPPPILPLASGGGTKASVRVELIGLGKARRAGWNGGFVFVGFDLLTVNKEKLHL